jgi:hypothetical protein
MIVGCGALEHPLGSKASLGQRVAAASPVWTAEDGPKVKCVWYTRNSDATVIDHDAEAQTHVVAHLPHSGKIIYRTTRSKKVGLSKNGLS